MPAEMTKAHFDNTLETVVAIAAVGIVFCAMWIVVILVDIEASKVTFFNSIDDASNTLALDVQQDEDHKASNGMEFESTPEKISNEAEIKIRRGARVSCQFKMMQIGSVLLLILLTYLLLVASNASGWTSALGALAVFGMFLRFQIGDEIRRQRWDRLTLLVSLLLLIAACLNMSTYAWKALAQGEIYVGPARIVGYDIGAFNNTNNLDPTTRTNLVVQWGSDWGCPYSSGKVCEADVQGVMCAVKPEGKKDGNRRRMVSRGLQNHQAGGHGSGNGAGKNQNNATKHGNGAHGNGTNAGWGKNEDVKLEKEEQQNKDLEKENEELKEEVQELKEKDDEEVDEVLDGEEAIEGEMIGDELIEDVDNIDANEAKEEALADEDEMQEEMDKDHLKDELKNATDDSVQDELEKDIDGLDAKENKTKEDLDSVLDEDENLKDEYEDYADEYFDGADQNIDAEIDEVIDEEDTLDHLDETETEIDEVEDQLEDEGIDQTYDYDDDKYDSDYWNYDWDSAWGDYGCNELFDSNIEGQTHDPSIPAGADDSWPYINIYGSCKYCDAYIMDDFAAGAFEKLEDYFLDAVLFMGLAFFGIGISLIGFIKYKLAPPAENQIELLGSEAGVIA